MCHLPAHLCRSCRCHPEAAPAGQFCPGSTGGMSRSAADKMGNGMLQCGQTVRRQVGRSGGNQMQADQSGVHNDVSTCTTPNVPHLLLCARLVQRLALGYVKHVEGAALAGGCALPLCGWGQGRAGGWCK